MDNDKIKGRRIDLLASDNPLKTLPEVKGLSHLIRYAANIGFGKQTGMGMIPIDWVDIVAWSQLTGTELYPDEAEIIREISLVYVSQHTRSKEFDCPAPFFTDAVYAEAPKKKLSLGGR